MKHKRKYKHKTPVYQLGLLFYSCSNNLTPSKSSFIVKLSAPLNGLVALVTSVAMPFGSLFIELLGAVGVATTGIASLINAIKKEPQKTARPRKFK